MGIAPHGITSGAIRLSPIAPYAGFVVHVLPRGFVRIRHYGLAANRGKRGRARPAAPD